MKVEIGKMTWGEYTEYVLNNYSTHEILPSGAMYEAVLYTAEDTFGKDLIDGGVFFTTFEEAKDAVLENSPVLGGQVGELALIVSRKHNGEVHAEQPVEYANRITPIETAVGMALKDSVTVEEHYL